MAQATAPLSTDELIRYSRHILLPGVGEAGQQRLKDARVLLVGAGGLGSPAALYLAAAGVGTLGLVDFDAVELTNLQRQLLHGTRDLGRPKVNSARDRLADVNPHIHVETHETRLTSANAMELLGAYSVIVDGSDNFQTRYLVNDACVLLGKPYVYGSIIRFEGQASVFAAADGPCYRCLFREPPPPGTVPTCAEGGVLGVLPGLVGTIQATETLKLLLGAGESLVRRLLLVDALRMRFREIALRRDPECPACGTRELRALIDYDAFCGVKHPVSLTGSAAHGPHEHGSAPDELTPRELARRMEHGDDLEIVDVREPYEWAIARIEGARLVPMGELDGALATFPRHRDVVLYCHHGIRSAAAAETLRRAGIPRAITLVGGIDRWSVEVDPAVRRY